MGNTWTSNKQDYAKNWSPYGEDFGAKRRSKRWSLRKPRGYYKTVSDLDVERGLPRHLHYQAPNSEEEDLFTADSRIPCVIHLHQRTRQDINHILRGSDAYAKSRPRSLDPRLLMDVTLCDDMDPFSPTSPKNSSFMSSPAHINPSITRERESSQRSSGDQTMRIDSSATDINVIKVDTSGAKFERQANLRRSQRLSSSSAVRQRANASQRRQLRHKHKTLVGLPGNISAELNGVSPRPYSVHTDLNGHSYTDGSTDESRSTNGQIFSPRQNQKNAEIQTDDVKVIPLTPAQRRMRQKGIRSNHTSPDSSQGSTEHIESPAAVPCPKVPVMKQTSTPINGIHMEDIIRPSSLDVKSNDTSTDEGRHTGESNPPTPVRSGASQEMLASPQLKKSPSTPSPGAPNSNGNHSNNNTEVPNSIPMRVNGNHQGEDRASSGFWSGTESAQHSSSSDITIQHAPVMNALQNMLKQEKHSPIFSNSAGQISPIVDNRPLVTSSAVSSSSVSINSKLSTMDLGTSASSLYRDDDERFQSTTSSVISVTLNRSKNASTLSLNSTASDGVAMSAAAMLKKSRKSKQNGGAYNFMNYEVDPLDAGGDEVAKVVKSRRSTRSMKHHKGLRKRLAATDDTVSMTSMADSSPQNTEHDGHSVQSAGHLTTDTASLCESMFSVDQEGYYTSMHEDCGLPKNASPSTVTASLPSMPESVFTDPVTPTPVVIVPPVEVKSASPNSEKGTPNISPVENKNEHYNSYHRAVKSNHPTPKTLLSPRGKSQSVKTPKHVEPPAVDFQSELSKRLSLRRPGPEKKSTKKRGAPPPPPKRASSLSSSTAPSPSPSNKSNPEAQIAPATPVQSVNSPVDVFTPTPQKPPMSPEEYYQTTPPPPPPIDALPPPPPELLIPDNKTSIPSPEETAARPPAPPTPTRTASVKSLASPVEKTAPKSPRSPKSPLDNSAPYQSIAAQAALLGSRMSEKKKKQASSKKLSSPKEEKLPVKSVEDESKSVQNNTTKTAKVTNVSPVSKSLPATSPKPKSPPPTAPKTASITPIAKIPPTVSEKPAVTSEEFTTKRTREQSPSYRASLARAAFFSSVSTPSSVAPLTSTPKSSENDENRANTPKSSENDINSAKTPPPTVAAKPKITPVLFNPKAQKISKTDENNEKSSEIEQKSETDKKEDNIVENGDISDKESGDIIQDSQKLEVEKGDITENSPQIETSEADTDNWLNKIEEYSSSALPQDDSLSSVTHEQDSAASRLGLSDVKSPLNLSTYESLKSAIHKSKRESLSGKSSNSPPVSPGIGNDSFTYKANGNKSPASTLERKRNQRLSTNGTLRNGISRKNQAGTSRDDFKALLLQNACRGGFGSQMTAAEKLQLNKPTSAAAALSRQRPYSMNDVDKKISPENGADAETNAADTRPMISLSDIQSAIKSGSATTSRIGRTNRRGPKLPANELGPKYATMSIHGKKHPPPSLSSKYNTRSRTPTRPMMSISEDNESEKSPEQNRIQAKVEER